MNTLAHPHIWPLTATHNGNLHIGGCDAVALARRYGTPLYVFDVATFRAQARAYIAAFATSYPAETHVSYASKALLNTAIARLVHEEHLGLDVVSGGELYVALRAGVPAAQIHMHGNAKPDAELHEALAAGIGRIVVDSLDELRRLAQMTAGRATPQQILLRIAPEVATDTHAHIQTGHAASKFGLPLAALPAAADLLAVAPGLRLRGLHAHLGSQLFDTAPYISALDVLFAHMALLRDRYGLVLDEVSPGGGLGVPYLPEQSLPDIAAFGRTLSAAVQESAARARIALPRLLLEPGRSLVARAGVALYGVVGRKAQPAGADHPDYLHIDGGMADNIRPALYNARYTALLANRTTEPATETVDVAGRYCESGDVLLRATALPHALAGDVLAVAGAGAYTLSMASTYNLVPRPALVFVEDGRAWLAQRRETYADLVTRDTV